jgi:hypothetical protein
MSYIKRCPPRYPVYLRRRLKFDPCYLVPLPIVKKGNLTVIENIIDDWNLEYTPAPHNSYFSSFEAKEEIDFNGASVNLKFCFAGEITNEFTGLVLSKCHEDETTRTDSACGDTKKTVTKTQYYNTYLVIKNFDFNVSIPGLMLSLINFINCKYFRSDKNKGPIIDWNCPDEYTYDKFKFSYRLRIIIVLKVVQTIYYIKNEISKVIVYPEVYVVLQGCSGCIESSYNHDYGTYICDIFNGIFLFNRGQSVIGFNRWVNLAISHICENVYLYTGPKQYGFYLPVDGLASEINSKNNFYLLFNTLPYYWIWLLYKWWAECRPFSDYHYGLYGPFYYPYDLFWFISYNIVGHPDCYLSPVSEDFAVSSDFINKINPRVIADISVTTEIYK